MTLYFGAGDVFDFLTISPNKMLDLIGEQMTCSFPWMTFWTALAAIGGVVVAILAIWGDWFRSKLAAPVLTVEKHNLRGDLTSFSGTSRAIFYHLKVKNLKTWVTARNCRVMLVAVFKRGPDNQFRQLPLPVPFSFFWSPAEFSLPAETVTTERVFDFGFLPERGAAYRPQIIAIPNNFLGLVAPNEAVRYSLKITSDNFDSPIQVFEVSWNGRWTDSLDEMENNLVIREISA